jgi:hypothetical protein
LLATSCADRYLVGFGTDAAAPGGGGSGGSGGAGTGGTGGSGGRDASVYTGGAGGAGGIGGSGGWGGYGAGGSGGAGGGGGIGGSAGIGGGAGWATGGGAGWATGGGAGWATGGGAGGGVGGSSPGTGGMSPPPEACRIKPAPMPLRPIAITPDHVADRISQFIDGSRAGPGFLMDAQTVKTSHDVMEMARRLSVNNTDHLQTQLRRWLRLDELAKAPVRDPLFPYFLRETELFLRQITYEADLRMPDENPKLLTLLTAPYTYIEDPELIRYYAADQTIPIPPWKLFKIVPDVNQGRSGIITHGSVLTALPRATARGRWLRSVFLCQEIPAPNSSDQPVVPEPIGPPSTYRQRLSQATAHEACQSCHKLIDPTGFALEQFDEAGRRRGLDNGLPIDASGRLEGPSGVMTFNGSRELGKALATHCDVQLCVVQKFMEMAFGQPLRVDDEASKAEIAAAFAASDFDLRELRIAITGSKAFISP